MQSLTCGIDTTGGCSNEPPEKPYKDPIGRRIYVHEESFLELAGHGREQAAMIFQMAARSIVLKAAHHAWQDATIFGTKMPLNGIRLDKALKSVWSDTSTWTLQQVAYRPGDPRLRSTLLPLISQEEEIFATCYFSHYYTFATGKKSADLMFADTNDIATLRNLMNSTSQVYSDMTLLNGFCLLIPKTTDAFMPGQATAILQETKRIAKLDTDELNSIRQEVLDSTKRDLTLMFESTLDQSDEAEASLARQIQAALQYAFTRGLLRIK